MGVMTSGQAAYESGHIAVVGLGYVGMAMAGLLARTNDVVALDVDPHRVNQVNQGRSPIIDPDVSALLANKGLRLTATTNPEDAYRGAGFIIVATPTDYEPENNTFDTSSVEQVVDEVARISPESAIVVKSTVPVGFTHELQRRYPNTPLLFSPEFLREGTALHDNLHPSRVIVSGPLPYAETFAQLLVDNAADPNVDVLMTDTTEAEAIKLFANTYLAMRVAFFNELDSFAVMRGLNAPDIVLGVSLDPRIGDFYNNPSFGYGGYCLPKDTKQLLANYDDVPQNLIRAVVEANTTRKDFIASKVLGTNPKVVGVFKLAMKAGSDNFRSSAIHGIITRIQQAGVTVIVYEPMLEENQDIGAEIVGDLDDFKNRSSIILTNRYSEELADVREKVFTRDIFGRD